MRVFVFAALAVLMTATSARASVLGSFVVKGPFPNGTVNELNDTDREFITKGTGNTDMTQFQVGDKVTTYLQFDTIQSFDGPPQTLPGNALNEPVTGGAGYNLLAKGVFTITGITPTSGGNGDFSFSGNVDFYEKLTNPGLVPFSTISAADTLISSLGSPFMTIGTTAPVDFIRALNAPISFAAIPTQSSGQTAVVAQYGMSLVSGGADLNVLDNGMLGATGQKHDFVGTVNAFAIQNNTVIGDNFFDLSTDTRLLFAAAVPEPSSMAVFAGLALCGGLRKLRARRIAKA
ncbi:MAG: hypothetical protein ACTHK7_13230 [Aureliella sp.]